MSDLEPTYRPRLVYPERALRLRREGQVVVEFQVGQDGAPQNVRVVEADPAGLFEGAALRYVGALRYPSFCRAKAAAPPLDGAMLRYIVRFELRGQP